jgi:hypothetical protein
VRLWQGVVALSLGELDRAETSLAGLEPAPWLDAEARLLENTRAKLREARRAAAAAASAPEATTEPSAQPQ